MKKIISVVLGYMLSLAARAVPSRGTCVRALLLALAGSGIGNAYQAYPDEIKNGISVGVDGAVDYVVVPGRDYVVFPVLSYMYHHYIGVIVTILSLLGITGAAKRFVFGSSEREEAERINLKRTLQEQKDKLTRDVATLPVTISRQEAEIVKAQETLDNDKVLVSASEATLEKTKSSLAANRTLLTQSQKKLKRTERQLSKLA